MSLIIILIWVTVGMIVTIWVDPKLGVVINGSAVLYASYNLYHTILLNT